jgi:hypothetical protein
LPRNGLIAAVLVILLAACGETGDATPAPTSNPTATPEPATPSPSAEAGLDPDAEPLLAAVETSVDEGTVTVDQTLVFEGSSVIPEGTSGGGTGQASFGEDRQMRFTVDLSAFEMGEVEMIRDGSVIYMRGQAFNDVAGEGMWLMVDIESDHPAAASFTSLASGQNDVSMGLFYLYGATGDVEVADGEPIGGQPTTHYTMRIDLESARDRIPESHAEALEDLIAGLRVSGIERELDAEAWVGEDGLVQRVTYTYALGRQAGGGTMSTTMDFSEYGAPIELGIPAEEEVVSIEELEGP